MWTNKTVEYKKPFKKKHQKGHLEKEKEYEGRTYEYEGTTHDIFFSVLVSYSKGEKSKDEALTP